MMIKKIILSSIVLVSFAIHSCDSGGDDPIPAIDAPAITIPSVSDVDGILIAINTRTKDGGVDVMTGTCQAIFYSNKISKIKVEAGSLKLNTKDLIKSDDNTYFYSPTTTDPKGIVYGSQIFWVGTANAANGIPAISDNDGGGFPNIPILSEFVNFDQTQDKTIDWVSGTAADSTILIVTGPSSTLRKVVASSVAKYTVTKAEIVKLGVGSGSVKIVNFNRTNKTIGGKTYAFIKQAVALSSKVGIK